MGKPEGKRLLEGLRYRWEEKIIRGLKGTGWTIVDRINLAEDMSQ
jgi:hypothetical protein